MTYSQKGDISHLFMIGGRVSYKTLIDIKDEPIILMKSEIRDIFEELEDKPNEEVLFALHYFTKPLDEVRTELKEKAKCVLNNSLSEQITQLLENIYEKYEKNQPVFQLGVQINVSWPEPEDIKEIKINHPKLKTILQVSNFSSLEERIKGYYVDYILIDTSRGEGVDFDIDEAIRIYNTIKKNNSALIGFAGGFSPENVRERVYFLKEKLDTRDFSIDAEGRLRTGKYLDSNKAEKYLKEAMKSFQINKRLYGLRPWSSG